MTAKLPFTDLHSFKDFVVYAQTYLPDRFPSRVSAPPEDQWSIDTAFSALRHGVRQAREGKGALTELGECSAFLDEAEASYRAGDRRAGFVYLENVRKFLNRIPTK
ncbi:hypothetical protein [Sphingomonas oryzagri]